MSSILHALVGHIDSSEKKSNVHTVTHEDVQVKSTISCQTQTKMIVNDAHNKINALMAKLGSTYSQIDEYSRRRTNEISEAVKTSVEKIVHLTRIEQQELLDEAEKQCRLIETDYQNKLMNFLNELDEEKAMKLAQLEKDLNLCQEKVLESARQRIDAMNEEANRLKMNILREAQAQSQSKVEEITDQVAQLGAEDASRRLKSLTTTVITTKSQSECHLNKNN